MNEEQLEKLAKRRVDERVGLMVHVVCYALINTGIVVTWWLTDSRYPWFIWPLLGWGAGLLAHVLTYWFGPGSTRGAQAIDREMRRLRVAQRG
jgi:hypothetical protein